MWQWFSNFLEKPSARRVKRRMKVRMERLLRSAPLQLILDFSQDVAELLAGDDDKKSA